VWYFLFYMSEYRVVSEGMYIIDPDGEQLPGLRKIPVWHGDHMPTLPEMRQISANQADIETQARLERLATGDEIEATIERILGERYYVPSHWPLVIQKRRVGRFLGYASLGTIKTSSLFVENDEEFELAPYWKNQKTKWSELPREEKIAYLKVGALTIGVAGATTGMAIWNNTH
jgi:hypothetical protein